MKYVLLSDRTPFYLAAMRHPHNGINSEKEALRVQVKRKQLPSVDEKGAKRVRQRLPHLPPEVVVRVLGYSEVRDIGKARLVCRMWRAAVDENAMVLWEKVWKALGTSKGLDRALNFLRMHVDIIRNQAPPEGFKEELTKAYCDHYLMWAPYLCRQRRAPSLPHDT